MFKKLLLATTLAGSVVATGASASAADFAQADPPPPSPRTTPAGDFSGAEPVATHAYVLTCSGYRICDGLQRFCANDGGHYVERAGGGSVVGVCVKF